MIISVIENTIKFRQINTIYRVQGFITVLEESATRLSRRKWIQSTFFPRPISFNIHLTTVIPTMFRSPKLSLPFGF